jgi:endonuclease YncB( thermonuclease family)
MIKQNIAMRKWRYPYAKADLLATGISLTLLTAIAQSAFTVVQVVDGDTIDVQTFTGLLKVRLTGIDAPESCNEASPDAWKKRPAQPLGQLAKRALRQLIEGKSGKLDCQPNLNWFGRTLRLVALNNGGDVGTIMMTVGLV